MRTIWLKLTVALAAALATTAGLAQDFGVHRGSSPRLGRNATPALSGPGQAGLGWWRPNALDVSTSSAVVDNNTAGQVVLTGVWSTVTQVGEWAENPFNVDNLGNPDPDPATWPAYRYARSTASASFLTPEVPAVPGEHATFEYRFDNANLGATPRNLALYVWLPIGPTRPGLGAAEFPIRYFVYEVFFGNGLRELHVVDTYNSGFGWVRLGAGGGQTTRLFQYDGANPVRIVLHNTVTRDVNGNLTETLGAQATNPLVYADAAMAVPQKGGYRSSPVVSDVNPLGIADIRTVAAFNEQSIAIQNNQSTTVTKGVVSSYHHDGTPGFDAPNNLVWRFSPLEEDTNLTVYQDDVAGANFTAGPSWVARNTPAVFRGVGFHDIDVTDNPLLGEQCTYLPNLDPGTYEIWAWIPGSVSGMTLSRDVTYEIVEGAAVTTVNIDQDAARGWVRLGTRRFTHDTANALTVRVLSLGPTSELTRKVYTDQVRFLGATNTAIDSTPAQVIARVNVPALGGLVDRPVVIIAAENGKIYCVDAVGNADGTTNLYWTYPSTPDPDNASWTDPNHVAGEDGPNGIAEMPSGFNLSSALVERIGGEDFLYITGNNGRAYCIEMAGRGDMDLTAKKPGTTRRRWSYPNDYPAQVQPANLGASFGSVSFGTNAAGPTLFVPSMQGRIFALDAVGNVGNKTTTVRWAYPTVTSPTLGSCEMTPAVEFDKVFVGFRRTSSQDAAQFVALDWDTGIPDWTFSGTTAWDPAGVTVINADDFVGGPVVIPTAEFTSGQADTVVVSNENRWITALNVNTGAVLWTTDELASPVLGNLTYTPMTVYNAAGVLTPGAPLVIVPTSDGRFAGLFAETTTTTVFGGNSRLAWGWFANASGTPMETSIAVGRNWMYGTDPDGTLYAWHDGGSVIGGSGSTPGQGLVPPNSPFSIPFRDAKIKFITKAAYESLRLAEGDVNNLTYAQATSAANAVNRTAFEWGETIYALVYDFPGEVDSNPDPSERVNIEFRWSAEGVAVRNLTARAKLFPNIGPGNPPTEPVSGELLDGFAVLSYTLQGSGTNALPPGAGLVSFGANAQFQSGGSFQSVAVDPTIARRAFTIANPIGIAVGTAANFQLGVTTDPANPEAAMNGSADIAATTPKLENRLLATVGLGQHNASKSVVWQLYDRSLMTLIRGTQVGRERGLDLVRVERGDLNWMGGAPAVYKPINPLNYPGFEDLPVNYPNISLDYPDVKRENALIIKDKFGQVENPLTTPISLNPPLNVDPNAPLTRALRPTEMDFEMVVPQFQPPNTTNVINSNGNGVSCGYYGYLTVFVDGTGNGSFDRRGRREAFRSMWIGGSVAVDEKIMVNRTELDLGSLPEGAGFDPIAPWLPASTFSPWGGAYQPMFGTFDVLNPGNVNMLNLRVAKAYDYGGALSSWGLFAPANNDRSWIDTQYNLWSDIDADNALNHMGGTNEVLLQKPRVGDRSATQLLTNPIRRDNYNLGVLSSALLASPTPAPPRIAVTAPFGTPVGTYLTDIMVIEDTNANESLRYDNATNQNPLEIATDPYLRLKFTVRETRLTNSHTRFASPMVHGVLAGNEPFTHQNVQPAAFRDLSGQLVVAYSSSNDLAFNTPQPTDANTSDSWRIYIASIDGMSQTAGGVVGSNPLRDLNSWTPQAGRLFNQAAGPFPTQPANDPLLFGPNVVPGTAKFGAPAFAALGGINPFNTASVTNPYMAYIGEAQIQTATGREFSSKIFLNRLQVDATGNVTSVLGPVGTLDITSMQKSKPAVVQVDGRATVYFTTTGAGQSNLYYNHFDGANFGVSQKLELGYGFESFGSVSAVGRTYQGVNQQGMSAGDPITELALTGKLRGRANRELFLARLRTGGSGQPINVPGTRQPFLSWGAQDERLILNGDSQFFTATGVNWQINSPIDLVRTNPTTFADESLLVAGTKKTDQETGIVTAELYSGGTVYFDTNQGTVRFTGFRPNVNQNIRVRYTPRLVRVSTVSSASYNNPSIVWDNRFTGEFDYYALPGGGNPNGAQISTDRFTVTYGRTAAGAGQTSRPYLSTFRFGHQLRVNGKAVSLHTQPNGNITNITFAGGANAPTGPYQVDPASGRVYYTAVDEGRPIIINSFTYADEATGAPILVNVPQNAPGVLLTERFESPVLIENAINETQLWSFIDPFDNVNAADRRPGLIWMIWTSTRGGGPDIYMQSIAPKYVPRPVGRTGN